VLASTAEVESARDGGPRGFTVLGWVDAGPRIRARHAMRPPSFLYPTADTDAGEADLPGGRAAAVAVHAAMLGDDEDEDGGEQDGGGGCAPPAPARAALASFVLSAGAPARLVALLARREVVDADTGAKLSPPGFDVVYLPWADDARTPERARVPPASQPVRAGCRDLASAGLEKADRRALRARGTRTANESKRGG
jgi:hypothetical protein